MIILVGAFVRRGREIDVNYQVLRHVCVCAETNGFDWIRGGHENCARVFSLKEMDTWEDKKHQHNECDLFHDVKKAETS